MSTDKYKRHSRAICKFQMEIGGQKLFIRVRRMIDSEEIVRSGVLLGIGYEAWTRRQIRSDLGRHFSAIS